MMDNQSQTPQVQKKRRRADRGKKRRNYSRANLANKNLSPVSLGIFWTDREKHYAAEQLAQMWTVPETTDRVLLNYQVEWNLQTKNADGSQNPAGYERFIQIRQWINGRVWSLKADPKMHKWQTLIEAKRLKWTMEIKSAHREANLAGRIDEYIRIKDAAFKVGQYAAAIRALLAIAVELGDLKTKNPMGGDNINNFIGDVTANIQFNSLTVDQLDRLRRGEHPYEVIPELKPKGK